MLATFPPPQELIRAGLVFRVESSALHQTGAAAGLHGRSPLLRLQSDERLIALVRRGNQHAFEALVGRYQSRLLAFCRHMLSSKEDAEDVLQEVFAAAFNAILADEREINVRPWLYRIARNRSLNHLRRATAVGVDSMDVHLSEGGLSTADKVHKREEFRLLIADVQDLPETQRTALLLREIDALSYEQIAEAMETTVPSVKSLLVRARVSLAEAAQARLLSCDEVRVELGAVAEGIARTTAPVRRHMRTCERCAHFRKQLRANNRAMAVLYPVGPLFLLKKTILAQLGADLRGLGRHRGRRRGRRGRRGRRAAGRHEHAGDQGGRRARRRRDRHRGRRRGQARRRQGPRRGRRHHARRRRAAGAGRCRGAVHAGPRARRLRPAARRRAAPGAGGRRPPRSPARDDVAAEPQGRRQAAARRRRWRRRGAEHRAARRRHEHAADRDRPAPPSPAPARSAPAPPRRPPSPRSRPPPSRRRSRPRSPRPEPTPGPTTEPTPEPTPDPTVTPTPEPTPAPTPETTPQPAPSAS